MSPPPPPNNLPPLPIKPEVSPSPKKNLYEAITQYRQEHPIDDEGHGEEPFIDSIFREVRKAEIAREFDLD